MALAKAVTTILSNKTAAYNGATTTLGDCTTIDTNTTVSLAIECKCTYDSSADDGCTVQIFASGDDTNYGDNPIDEFDMPFTANTTKRWSRAVIPAERYLKVRVKNNSTVNPSTATAIYVYAHKQTA